MKSARSLFSFGAACILLCIASVCLAVAIWHSCAFSVQAFFSAILMSLVSLTLSLTIGRRSLFHLFSAIRADIAAYLRWSEQMNRSVGRWFYWRLVHPIFWRLVHCWCVISRRRALIIVVVVLIVALVVLVTFLIPPTYSSTARISDQGGYDY
jgi:hypothetical protein